MNNIVLWIPRGLDPASQTMDIANVMQQHFHVSQINNDLYNNNFTEYYDRHIRQNEGKTTFCSKNNTGINVQYLINNANKPSYVTLLSLETNPIDPTDFQVLAIIVFRSSPTAKSVKIQAFCSNQKMQTYGAGTKLLNFFKRTLLHMNISGIYLNPIINATPYYSGQQFKVNELQRKIYDTSSPSPTKSKKKSKPSNPVKPSKPNPTMSINLRATKNWTRAKTKLRAYQALTRRKHGKSHYPILNAFISIKIDKIINSLSQDHREIVTYSDIIELLEKRERIVLSEYDEAALVRYLEDKYEIY
jgi:hypothetical protein